MTTSRFSNQVAIVTGAGEGIGREIARQLAHEGAAVLLNDLDEAKAHKAAAVIEADLPRGGHGRCEGIGGDASDVDAVRGLVDAAVEQFGRLDIAVANAGITMYGDFFELEPASFHKLTAVNLGGSFFLAQAAARQMRRQKQGGRILFMSSVTGHQAIKYLSAYGMTKAGLEALARSLVVELSPFDITVNCIAPGATITPRNLRDDPQYEKHWGEVIPTGKPATTADIACAALFLLSPQAGQITGQTLVVDGGWTGISPAPSLDFVDGGADKKD